MRREDTNRSRPAIYAWITGERTNVGDSLLRRPYVRALQDIDAPLDLWINRSTPDFLSGIGLDETTRLTPSFGRWYLRVVASAVRRRTLLVLNAGEFAVRPSGAAFLALMALASVLVRIRGGASVWLGVSIPRARGRGILRGPYRLAGRWTDYVQWRDSESSAASSPRAVGPDWGFLPGTGVEHWRPSSERTYCGFVLRGDRPSPSPEWREWALGSCEALGLTPIIVVQVRQDATRAHELADSLHAEVLEWPDGVDHAEQESRIRDIYSRCLVVIGDRLHGLVVAASEGAIPLGWVESSQGKIRRHFDVVDLAFVGQLEGRAPADLVPLTSSDVTTWQALISVRVRNARNALFTLQRSLMDLATQKRPQSLVRYSRNQPPPGDAASQDTSKS